MLKYLFLTGTLIATVYGQLIIKLQASKIHEAFHDSGGYLFQMLIDPLVMTGFAAAGVAALCWLMAVRSFDVGYAYPFMALSFVLVPIGGAIWFAEPVTKLQIVGLFVIMVGVAINALARA
jgi:multidrug transporter EmrE-like cation transporter